MKLCCSNELSLEELINNLGGGRNKNLRFDVLMCYELVYIFSSLMECFCLLIDNI